MGKQGENLLSSFETIVLQKIFVPELENRCWRRCRNSEIYKLYDEHHVVKFIKLGRLRWVGHVMRMEESNPIKKVICTKTGGNGDGRRDSSKLMWCDMFKDDVTWSGFRNWRISAVWCFRPSALEMKHISSIMLKILGVTI